MERVIRDTSANPGPIGLFGFGATTVLLNLHNIGLFELNNVILAMGIFYGGIAQLVAGILENKKGNTFGSTVFVSYGSFWLSLVAILVGNKYGVFTADHIAVGSYMVVWGLITLIFFIGTLNGAAIGKLVFGTLTLLFALLALHFFFESAAIGKAAGVVGIICGLSAIYEGAAVILNDKYGKVILPM